MEYGKIERFVSDVLTISAVEREGKEQAVGQALYHALMAAGIYDLMGEEERELTGELMKKLQFFFRSKFSLKERKERKKKENFPPNPLLKEKDKNRKEEKNIYIADGKKLSLTERRDAFRKECFLRLDEYDKQLLTDFYNHYSQEDSKGRMHFETERFWNLDSRLELWMNKRYNVDNKAAAERLKKARGKQQKEQATAEQQQVQAAQREAENSRLEEQIKASRKGAVTSDEQIARNPNGVLAQIKREREARERATKKNET